MSDFPLAMFIDTIKLLQSLVVLKVEGMILTTPSETSDAIHPDRIQVYLPHLDHFRLKGEFALLLAYLVNIDVPPTCSLQLITLVGDNTSTSLRDTVHHLVQLVTPRIISAMSGPDVRMDISLSPPPKERYRGNLGVTVRRCEGDVVRHEPTWCFLEWEASPERATLREVLAFIPSDVVIRIMNVLVDLNADEWVTMLPLLSRVRRIDFTSYAHAANFLLARHHINQQELRHLEKIVITDTKPLLDENCDPWPAMLDLLKITKGWTDFTFSIHASKTELTVDDRASLSSYGEIIDLAPGRWHWFCHDMHAAGPVE
ncbi:unnamed protein product [Peniophora sp. CBMAI 1063]|nr:unnamed protein product [Peniophora sp. CBMAI 1063]